MKPNKKNQEPILYCVGFNFKPIKYTGQKEPIFIGELFEVNLWIRNYFKSIYEHNQF